MNRRLTSAIIIMIFFIISQVTRAQGPAIEYFYSSQSNLPWIESQLYFHSGSFTKLPVLPVIDESFQGPVGSMAFTSDISYDGRFLFPENFNPNLTANPPFDQKMIVIPIDNHSSDTFDIPALHELLTYAELSGSMGVIFYSNQTDFPQLYIEAGKQPGIPAFTVSKEGIEIISEAAGFSVQDYQKDFFSTAKESLQFRESINQWKLTLKSAFKTKENNFFSFHFADGQFRNTYIDSLATLHEQSLSDMKSLFEMDSIKWEKHRIFYFRDYDEKVYYTGHWGKGLSTQFGNYLVSGESIPDYALIIHENAHYFLYYNWGLTSSFMFEGFSMYAEASFTQPDKNRSLVSEWYQNKKLPSLSDMFLYDIGSTELTSRIGYPAAGAFVEFLIEKYGLQKAKAIYLNAGSDGKAMTSDEFWNTHLSISFPELEKEWINWIEQ